MARWVPAPERAPFKCPFTHRDSPTDGPYWEADLHYWPMVDAGGAMVPGRRPEQLYVSVQALKELAGQPGSPIVVLDRSYSENLDREMSLTYDERDDLRARVEELEAEVALLRETPATQVVEVEAIERFMEGFARRTGPKPKVKA